MSSNSRMTKQRRSSVPNLAPQIQSPQQVLHSAEGTLTPLNRISIQETACHIGAFNIQCGMKHPSDQDVKTDLLRLNVSLQHPGFDKGLDLVPEHNHQQQFRKV